jgi:hypothetical protein
MSLDYLHNHSEFEDLIRIVADEKGIDPALVEKDYWIMHCMYGLQQLKLTFELKGGTSLSKGFQIINRFSEDIDIRIEPPPGHDVKVKPTQLKQTQIKTRTDFYDWLAQTISINGIKAVERDTAADDIPYYRSAGIRLRYDSITEPMKGLREGVLLEVGFDTVAPNTPKDISSWAYDHAAGKVEVIDNRARAVPCYAPGYTFVEKLQTISTKFRRQRASGSDPVEFTRHYYDVHALLQRPDVQQFIVTQAYIDHKARRFRRDDNQNIAQNEAFLLSDPKTRALYTKAYEASSSLYYKDKPTFEQILDKLSTWASKL